MYTSPPQVPVTAPVPSQIVKHELQKDLGEGVVTSQHDTCTVHVWHKKGNVTRDVSWQSCSFLSTWKLQRREWKGSKRTHTLWGRLFSTHLLLVSYHLQLCQVAGTMVNNRILLEVYKNLSIKRNCVALPRCSLGRKVLERVSQYQMVVGWRGQQLCWTWEAS